MKITLNAVKKSLLAISALLFVGFCIITSTSGDYRYYIAADLPFVYRLHNSTPTDYFPVIWEAATQWNDVEGAYFLFQEGPTTANGILGRNFENLVFFDIQGQNFEPGSGVIAFSSTWTTTSGGYRAVESDFIWNARDFPPGLNGEPNRQDLLSVSVHELGHHLGLDHTGLPSGASSGCGPLVQQAVMWWASSNGDTTKRRLHIEDIMGLISIYPNWVIQGKVTDNTTGLAITGSEVTLEGTFGSEIGPVINPIGNRRNKVGLISNKFITNEIGEYKSVVKDRIFSIQVDEYGYFGQSQEVTFDPPSGIGNTQFLTVNFNLEPTPIVDLNVSIIDTINNLPVIASYELYWMNNLDSALISSQTNSNGTFSESVSSVEYYRLIFKFNHPYKHQIVFDSLYIPESGLTLEIRTKPVSNILVLDLPNISDQNKIFEMLSNTEHDFAVWDNIQTDSSLSLNYLDIFQAPVTLIWATASPTQSGLAEAERILMIDHLKNGGRLILAGQNVSEYLQGDSLIENYIGVKFSSNYNQFPVRGFENDIIGDGISFSFLGGSKDQLSLSDNPLSNVSKSFHYGTAAADTVRIAGVRFENESYFYRGFFLGFGFEFIPVQSGIEILSRALNYTNDTSFVTYIADEGIIQPMNYGLEQNYPNPFNPSTTINFTVPNSAAVKLTVYNILGETVNVLINKEMQTGSYNVIWNADDFGGRKVSSGVYFYELKASSADGKDFNQIRKMVLLK